MDPMSGPTVVRLRLGSYLRMLRESSGFTREEAGEAIRASDSKISRLELGRHGFKLRDLHDLLTLYGITDPAERAALADLARQANRPGWWHSYAEILTPALENYLGLEQAASVIRGYEPQAVPALLRTGDYARAVLETVDEGLDEGDVDLRLALVEGRHHVLTREAPPHVWMVLDEAVLRRPYGGAEVMRAQLARLLDLTALPHVTVQILPFAAGGHPATAGPITVLDFPGGELPKVVYLEHLTGASFPDRAADVVRYWHVLNRLAAQAWDPVESRRALEQVRASC